VVLKRGERAESHVYQRSFVEVLEAGLAIKIPLVVEVETLATTMLMQAEGACDGRRCDARFLVFIERPAEKNARHCHLNS
jgi:hypothetical protein